MTKFVAIETLLSWQQANCAITPPCESISHSYLMHMFLGTKSIIGLPCFYGNAVLDMFLRITYNSILHSYCGKTFAHQNHTTHIFTGPGGLTRCLVGLCNDHT